jgi:hypothetical protein
MARIVVHFRVNDCHVHIDGQKGLWDCGKTVTEAIGSLILTHGDCIVGPVQVVYIYPSANYPSMKGRELSPQSEEYRPTKALFIVDSK